MHKQYKDYVGKRGFFLILRDYRGQSHQFYMRPAVGVPISMAKHLTRSAVRNIASERAGILAELSREAVRVGRDGRAVRYVELARAVCGKGQTDMPSGFVYCRNCLLPLMPGLNCTVRLTGHKVVSECRRCGTVRRMPYLKEQKRASAGVPAQKEEESE